MATSSAWIHTLVTAGLAAGLGWSVVEQRGLARRLEVVELERPPVAAASSSSAEALAREAELTTLRGRLEAAEKSQTSQLGEVRSEVHKLWAELMKAPDGAAPASAATPGDAKFDDAVRAVVDRYVMEQKFREQVKKATGPLVPKKPAFVQLATALKLRPDQAERFGQEIQGIQHELYDLLQVPRTDGVSPLEEIQMAEQYPEGSPKRTEAFLKLMKLTIPDTQETYFERAVALASRVKEGSKAYFDREQTEILDTLDLDWFGIRMQ